MVVSRKDVIERNYFYRKSETIRHIIHQIIVLIQNIMVAKYQFGKGCNAGEKGARVGIYS